MLSVSHTKRQENRADVRRILRYVRAADRIREITTTVRMNATLEMEPVAHLWSASGGLIVRASGYKLNAITDWMVIENLLAKMRPLYHDSENCSFRSVVKIMPKHVKITGDISFEELEKRWDAVLSSSQLPVPEGERILNVLPGYDAVATKPGWMEIGFDGQPLTAREVIDLSLYGELVHLDQNKERKRLRIRKSEMNDAFKVMVVGVLAQLLQLIDHLRLYAQGFLDHFPQEKLDEIEANLA